MKLIYHSFLCRKKFVFSFVKVVIIFLFFTSCSNPPVDNKIGGQINPDNYRDKNQSHWLNHNDSVKYVGKETCRKCHASIYETFMQTGMGSSIGPATKQKSSADFSHAIIYDKSSGFYYRAYWQNDTLRVLEFRLAGKDTVYKRIEKIDFIVGSGQHTNSHLQIVNGYITQAPMTFYTQKKKWDLPPGFENGNNTRFSRLIGLECMSCHNAFPKFEMGSENKFTEVPLGIDCERCHGPGSLHVNNKMTGIMVDTSEQVDYSIVNPAKLPVDRQFDLCMRCHLQGNAVLAEGKSWYDFKPGMKLSDYITVFLPKFKNADDEFIMASHADRLKQSKCFISSLEKSKQKVNSLRPFRDALTCVSCHNPHVSVKNLGDEHFNSVCNSCHKEKKCSEKEIVLKKNNFNCVSCHMPQSGSKDIPHVSIHDHYIRKPLSKKEVKKIKEFLGLYAINTNKADSLTRAKAYLNQYEKFEPNNYYLDSAAKYLNTANKSNAQFELLIRLSFIKSDFASIRKYANVEGTERLLKEKLIKKNVENSDAWTCYRIGDAFMANGESVVAEKFYKAACDLAAFHPDFMNKYGTALMKNKKNEEARTIYMKALIENPRYVAALTNLGYLNVVEKNFAAAQSNYDKALAIDPDNIPLLKNVAGLKMAQQNFDGAADVLLSILKKNPQNTEVKNIIFNLAEYLSRNRQNNFAIKLVKKYLLIFVNDADAKGYLKSLNLRNAKS